MNEQKLIFTYIENPSEVEKKTLIGTNRGYYSMERVNVNGIIDMKILENLVETAEIFTSPNPAKRVEFMYQFD